MDGYTFAWLKDHGTGGKYRVLVNKVVNPIAYVRFVGMSGKDLFGKSERMVSIHDLSVDK